MRRHGTNFTALAAILGGAVMGAGATMALANATDGVRGAAPTRNGARAHDRRVRKRGAVLVVDDDKQDDGGDVYRRSPSTGRPRTGDPSASGGVAAALVTTDVGHQAQLHSRLQEVQARAQEVQVRVQAAQVRAEEAQVRARQAQVRAQKLQEAMTELREDAGSTIDDADLERLRAIIAEVREQRRAHDQSSGK